MLHCPGLLARNLPVGRGGNLTTGLMDLSVLSEWLSDVLVKGNPWYVGKREPLKWSFCSFWKRFSIFHSGKHLETGWCLSCCKNMDIMILDHFNRTMEVGPSNMRLQFDWCQDPSIDASIHWLLSDAPPKGMRGCETQDEELPPTLRLY